MTKRFELVLGAASRI